MNKHKLASEVLARLSTRYPSLKTALDWQDPWQLLVATVLSAQCTDIRVNRITPGLFEKWPGPQELAQAHPRQVEQVVRPAGFFRNKSRNLVAAAQIIVSRFSGQVPRTMEELTSLPGVARKTANIILSNAFGINQGIAVDTHVKRIAFRLDLTDSADPKAIEKDLMPLFPLSQWGNVNHMLVFFGREVCTARRPRCPACELADLCPCKGIKI